MLRKFHFWQIRISNSSGGNLHDGVRDGIDQFIRFQTPAEEIYTERMSYPCPEYLISNSSGGNLHPRECLRLQGIGEFQTPAEEIYTSPVMTRLCKILHFKLQRRKFTPKGVIRQDGVAAFQTPAEEIYTFARIFLTVLILISNSSGGNLHPYCRLACRLWRLISNSSGGNLHRNDAKPQDKIYPFQTPAEEIYTLLFSILGTSLNHFKLQRRKFTQR